MRKEDKQLMARLEKLGCEVVRQRSGHWRVTRNGRLVTVLAHSRSDRRGYMNMIADLRRRGVSV